MSRYITATTKEYSISGHVYPSVTALALHYGVHRATVKVWIKRGRIKDGTIIRTLVRTKEN